MKIGILISGSGSNMIKLIESCQNDKNASINIVISNNPDAKGIDFAKSKNINITLPMPDNSEKTIAETLLEPTKIYVKLILDLLNSSDQIKAISNITGGGVTENLPRIFENENIGAKINLSSWVRPSIFNWLQELGNIDEKEMLKTLNCGIGMILVVNKKNITKISKILEKKNEDFYIIGEIIETQIDSPKIIYHRA